MADTLLKMFTNSFVNCTHHIELPNSREFLSQLTPPFVIAITMATVLSFTTLVFGVMHLLYIGIYMTHAYRKAFVLYLAGTAPFISVFALAAMFMPRIWFLAHLLSFFYFCNGLYIIICLLMHIVNGRKAMVKKMNQTSFRINVQTPPFCCVFSCLPKFQMETGRIRFCEMMVLQAPCIRLVATILSLVLYFEFHDASLIALKVIDLVSLPSLLLGIYGCHILVTTVSKLDELCPYRYIMIFRLLDIYLMFFGLQQPVFEMLAHLGVFGCGTILSATDSALFWKSFATVCESFIVSVTSTLLLKPSQSALFDKYPSCRSAVSATTSESTA